MTLFPPVAPEGYVWSHRFDEAGTVVEYFGNPCPRGTMAVIGLGDPHLVPDTEARARIEEGMANYYRMIGCKPYSA